MDGVEVLNSWKGVLNVIYRYGGLLKDFYKWVFINCYLLWNVCLN